MKEENVNISIIINSNSNLTTSQPGVRSWKLKFDIEEKNEFNFK
jgi:hypothetical protein